MFSDSCNGIKYVWENNLKIEDKVFYDFQLLSILKIDFEISQRRKVDFVGANCCDDDFIRLVGKS